MPLVKKRCSFPSCRKKVQVLMTIRCKCHGQFCRKHKNEEAHGCTFDHQEAFRTQFMKKQTFRHVDHGHTGGGGNCAY